MKSFLYDIKIALLFVGTIVGAGFASGRELLAFFGGLGEFLVPVCIVVGILFCYTAWLFFQLGRMIKPKSLGDITRAIFKRGAIVMDIFIVFSYFVVFAAMLAGVESLISEGFGLNLGYPFFSILTAIVAVVVLVFGMNGLIRANSVLVPVVVVFVLGISLTSLLGSQGGVVPIRRDMTSDVLLLFTNSLLYVCMNMLMTSAVLAEAGDRVTKRTSIASSILGATIITLCIMFILYAIFTVGGSALGVDMPMLAIAGQYGNAFKIIGTIVIWMAIFTTLVSSVHPIFSWSQKYIKNKAIGLTIIMILGFLLSLFGFAPIVDFLYPVMGAVGLFFILSASVFYFINAKKQSKKRASEKMPQKNA